MAREHPRQHEQKIGQAVQVFERVGGDVLGARQRPTAALGAPADRAGDMAGGGRRTAAGQNEFLERRQSLVESVQFLLEPVDVCRVDHAMSGNAQFAAQIEKVVLHFGQTAGDRRRQRGHAQDHADGAIGLIDGTVGLDAQVFLGHARAVSQTGAAVVAGSRINLAQPVAHRSVSCPGCDGSTRFAKVAPMKHSPELQAALDAAEQAAAIARSLYQRNVEVRIKADKSPVTEADVRCEIAIREILEARFPSYGFFGEETGSRDARRREPVAGGSHRRHQGLRARVSDVFHANRADAPRRDRARRVERAGVRRAELCRARLRRVSERQARWP